MNEFKKGKNMVASYIVCILSYLTALVLAILTGSIFRFFHPLLTVLMADLVGTMVIFLISTILKNTSLYDPYWNVAPLIISLYYFIFPQNNIISNIRYILVFTIVFIYSVRLTYNWLREWRGLKDEDWRYQLYREKMGKNFWLINLVGLQLMPTVMVYLGSISLYPAISLRTTTIGFIDILAVIIAGGGIFLETLADQQLYKFRKKRENAEQIIKTGLWHYSRHPNYFGEILFWWGLYLFAIAAEISFYWAIIGPIFITILFYVVSIPMMEKRNLERKPEYKRYKEQTTKLIPWFQKN
jgi:steroid 5-alpha reductase family enzyme